MISVVVISKDERALDETLREVGAQAAAHPEPAEVVVVDASEGRLDDIRDRHPGVRWVPFARPHGVGVSIPHQRNAGVAAARGATLAFTDAGCRPDAGWLAALTAPIGRDEQVTAGAIFGWDESIYDRRMSEGLGRSYLPECPSGNMAFTREAFRRVGGFDESFEYGSDIDFSWRLREAGCRIRLVPDAVIRHDWGDAVRQLRRGYRYGRARARLYRKHPRRLLRALRDDPMVLVYPAFLLGLPLTARVRAYPLLLLVPAWRNRRDGAARVVADHLAFGLGVLREAPRR